MRILLAVLTGLTVSPAAYEFASAQTRNSATVESLRVGYGDLDLSSTSGADRMLRRIRHAAQNVCGVRYGARPVADITREHACMNEAMDLAVSDVGSAPLAVRHARQTLANGTLLAMSVEMPITPPVS